VVKHTILKLLKDIGCACAAYHNSHVRDLRVRWVALHINLPLHIK
jgi:hypothetical protein